MIPKSRKGKGNHAPVKMWKKGQSGNPGGLPKDTIAKKELKVFTASLVAEAFSKMLSYTAQELEYVVQQDQIPIIESIVAKCLLHDRKGSQLHNLERIMERIIGRVPVVSELTGPGGIPLQNVPPAIIIKEVEAVRVDDGNTRPTPS